MRACLNGLIGILILSSFATGTRAVPPVPVDYADFPHLDRTEYLDGRSNAVAAYSLWGRDYFAVANENTSLHLYEVVAGEVVPRGIGHTTGVDRDVAIRDWYAFVATGSGLSAVNIAVPDAPMTADFVNLTGDPIQLSISATHAFVACQAEGLYVVDITDPQNMSVVGSYGAGVKAVWFDSDRLGILKHQIFEILDVSDPTNPALMGSFAVAGNVDNCALQGGVAYVSSASQGKQLDISDPTAITLIQDLPLISYQVYNRLDIHGSELVHVGSHNLGFVDFATGAVTRRSEQVGDVRDAAVIAGKIMAVGDDRLEIYDDGLHLNPTAGDVPEADLMEPQGIMLDNVLYGISEATGTSLMATELGGGLLWELPLDTQGYLVKAAVQRGNTVVTLASTGILSVVTASRYGAVLRGTLEFQDGFYSGFDGDRRIAFLDDQTVVALDPTIDRNIRVVDVSDPEQPAQIGRYPISLGSPTHITVAGSTVVVSSWYGYEVFDAQDRFSLQSLAVQAVAGAQYRIYATDSYVHALLNAPVSPLGEVGPERLDTWDISDPTAPVLVNQLNLASYGNLFFAGDWAYQGDSGLILDFSDPAHPVPAGNFSQPLPSNISWVTVVAGTEYIVADHVPYGFNPGRFAVYMSAQGATGNISAVEEDLPAPGTGLTLQAVPNPFNPRVTLQFELAVAGPTRVQVFDLRGRLVADLGEKHRQAGPQSVTWDGVDRQGRDLPSGVYLAQVSTPIGHASRKIVLAR